MISEAPRTAVVRTGVPRLITSIQVNGGLRILDRSEVSGNVVVKKPGGWSWGSGSRRKPVRVEIGENVVVHGDLVFEQWVELKLHDTAKVGEIIGDEVEMIGGP